MLKRVKSPRLMHALLEKSKSDAGVNLTTSNGAAGAAGRAPALTRAICFANLLGAGAVLQTPFQHI